MNVKNQFLTCTLELYYLFMIYTGTIV